MPPPTRDSCTPSPPHSASHSSRVSPSAEGIREEPRLVNSSPPPLASASTYYEGAGPLTSSPPSLSTATVPTVYSSSGTTYTSRPHSLSGRESASPEPAFALPTLQDSQYSVASSYRRDSSSYAVEPSQDLGFTYPGSTSSYRQLYSSPTSTSQAVPRSTEYRGSQPLTRSQFSSGSLHEVHTRQSTPQMPSLSTRHSISHISHSLPQSHYQAQLNSYGMQSGTSTTNPSSPSSSQTLSTHTSPQTPSYPSWSDDVQQPYIASQSFDTASYFPSSSADVSPTITQSPTSYVMDLPSDTSPLSTTAPLAADSTTSRYSSPRPVLAPLHGVHTQVQNIRRSSMPVVERHYSAPTVMTVQPQQVYDASHSYAYERQSYGIKQDVGVYGRHEAYGYRDVSMWKGRGVGGLVG